MKQKGMLGLLSVLQSMLNPILYQYDPAHQFTLAYILYNVHNFEGTE